MKHSLLFWSRKAHCWAGVYLSAVTLLWLGEMAILPSVYEPRFEATPSSLAVSSAGTPVVSVQDVLDRFSRERADGEPLTPDTVAFLPKEGSWVVRDAGRYVAVTYDAHTGAVRGRAFDSDGLVEEKNGLAWLSPELGAALKFSFQPLFILLCMTGLHLLLGRKRRPGKEKERAATLDAVRTGETCLYERANDPYLAGRLASLGFLPGVAVRMLRNAKRGPLLVLARHTRVALGRGIASGIVVARRG